MNRPRHFENEGDTMNAVVKQKALVLAMLMTCIAATAQISVAQEVPSDYQQVMKIVGKQGDYKSNVLKVNIPRNEEDTILLCSSHQVLSKNLWRMARFLEALN
jgi:cytochrome c556